MDLLLYDTYYPWTLVDTEFKLIRATNQKLGLSENLDGTVLVCGGRVSPAFNPWLMYLDIIGGLLKMLLKLGGRLSGFKYHIKAFHPKSFILRFHVPLLIFHPT